MIKCGLLAVLLIVPWVECNQGPSYHHIHERVVEEQETYWIDDPVNEEEYISTGDNEEPFRSIAAEAIIDRLQLPQITSPAKNVIIFVSEDTPASLIRQGRKYLYNCTPSIYRPKQSILSEYFYDIALVKTECYDQVEANPACTATAMLTGIRVNADTVGVAPNMSFCSDGFEHFQPHKLSSIAAWAQKAGKRTGFVTTSQVTSPSVSPYYGHSCNAYWESDADVPDSPYVRNADLAAQLVHGPTGQNLNVILGGGRANFLPEHRGGVRLDRRNLIKDWVKSKHHRSEYAYIETRKELWDVCRHTDYIFGLFNSGPLDPKYDPSLRELTEVAIKLLQRPDEEEGYVLFVEHANQGVYENDFDKAEAQIQNIFEMVRALEVARDLTCDEETLIIFTSNYASRNTPRATPYVETDELFSSEESFISSDFSSSSSSDSFSSSSSSSSFFSEYYSDMEDFPTVEQCEVREVGEETFLLARGPWSHMFNTIISQYLIAHYIGFAACIGDGFQACDI